MATITISVSHPQLSTTKVFNVTDAEMSRIATACRYKFTPEGKTLITNQEAVTAVTDWYMNWLSEITKRHEVAQAQNSATTGISKITPN